MSEAWFDTQAGELLVGAAAVEQRLEQSAPHIVVPLSHLIHTEDFPYASGDFELLDTREWTRDDYIAFGQWALALVRTRNESSTIKRAHLNRLRILGLGPSGKSICTLFHTLSEFKAALGAPPGYDRVRYADWSMADFAAYAAAIETETGHIPQTSDYQAAFNRGDGPGVRLIHRRVGGLRELHELLGYPDVHKWEEADFVQWGVKVMVANDVSELDYNMPIILQGRRRGPHSRTITDEFGNWQAYKAKVAAEYERYQAQQKEKIARYHTLCREGRLPAALIDAPDFELLATGGKYTVTRACLPDTTAKRLRTIALAPSQRLIANIRTIDPGISAGRIETEAVMLGVFDDIWPMETQLLHLRVSNEELAAARALNALKKRRQRAQKRV